MQVDYHMHTPLCNHAEGEPREFVERAIAIGLDEIGFSEHSPWMIQEPDEKLAPTEDEFDQYVHTVQQLQQEYGDETSGRPFPIRLGIEMDFVPDRLDTIREWQTKYPWDYVIGSVHHLGAWGFDNPAYRNEFDNRNVDQVYDAYFSVLEEMISTGLFDVVGHMDLIKKFGHRPQGDFGPRYRQIASCIKRADMAVELNTSGLDKEVHEFYPSPAFLKALVNEGVPITMGSDSHRPQELGRHFSKARAMLHDLGLREIAAFEKRKRRMVPLDCVPAERGASDE